MTTITPVNQTQTLNPYAGRLFDFNTTDSRIYLSGSINTLFGAIGENCIIEGFEINSTDYNTSTDIITITVNPGKALIDSTLIEILEQTTLTMDVTNALHNGTLIITFGFTYSPTIYSNKCIIKLLKVFPNGSIDPEFMPGFDKIVLASFDYDNVNKLISKNDFNSILEMRNITILNKQYEIYPESYFASRIRDFLSIYGCPLANQTKIIIRSGDPRSLGGGRASYYWIDTDNFDLFYKSSDMLWHRIGNVLGLTAARTTNITSGLTESTLLSPNSYFIRTDLSLNSKYDLFASVNGTSTKSSNLEPLFRGLNAIQCSYGYDGRQIYLGLTTPSNSLGNFKDHYINTVTFDWYDKIGGTWILRGNLIKCSGNIVNNNPMYAWCGLPDDSNIGLCQEQYLDVNSYLWYQKQCSNNIEHWINVFDLKTALPDPSGITYIFGSTIPDYNTEADIGDMYIQKQVNPTYKFLSYTKIASTGTCWSDPIDMKDSLICGPITAGTNFTSGFCDPDNSAGHSGDYYLQLRTKTIFYKNNLNVWIPCSVMPSDEIELLFVGGYPDDVSTDDTNLVLGPMIIDIFGEGS